MDVSSLTPLLHRALNMGCVCLKPSIMVEEVKYKVKHELAEGGFSTIDLVEDTRTGREFVIKRITCHSTEDQNIAIKEIQMHRQFGDHRNILEVVRSDITGTADIVHNTTSQVNIVLPYFQRGSLQDELDKRCERKDPFPEEMLLRMFLGVCLGVEVLHSADTPVAHRDIKPQNILLDKDMTPVLMDLGSACPARVTITSMKEAQYLQDTASERCSMPYRPPELFSVSSKCEIDERTDIWSLGCLLYAMCFYKSPFETVMTRGDSVALAVQNSNIAVPNHSHYSDAVHDLIRELTNVDINFRPNIKSVIEKTEAALDAAIVAV